MRSRLLNALTLLCLLLCGATLLTACLAAYFQRERWTVLWKDSGVSIENQLHGVGWNGFSYGWIDYLERITLGADPGGMQAVRDRLGAITPPNQRYAIPDREKARYFAFVYRPLLRIGYSRRVTGAGQVSFFPVLFLFAVLPLARGGAVLIRRGRAATQVQAARHDPALTLTDRIDATMNRVDERLTRFAHRRARCPLCDELIPRRWAWDQSPRDHRCGNCYVLLRERPITRHLGNMGMIVAGWGAAYLTIGVGSILLRRARQWDVALCALAMVPIMGACAYILFPYITRFDVTAPRCSHCDYNLTGTASTVCPECGAAVELPEFVM